jgi:hypothetical protein
VKEQLDLLYECVVRSALRTSSPDTRAHGSASAVMRLLRDLRPPGRPEIRARVCREFREVNIRSLFHIAHVSSERWLPVWAKIEREWKDSPARSALTCFYRCMVDTRRTSAAEELLAVELAHLTKFLPLASLLEENPSEHGAGRATEPGGAIGERETLLHPDVDENGSVVGAYAFDYPDWSLPFVDDVIATTSESRYFTRDEFSFVPMQRFEEGIDLIGHMGHSGSTLLAKVIQQRLGRPVLCEPRELERVLNPTGRSDLGIYFDVLLSSNPRPAGIKLSSGHLGHVSEIRRMLEDRYCHPVRLYLLSRATGAVVARTVRSNSPTLVDKVWSTLRTRPSRRKLGLLVAHVEAMADYIRRAEEAPAVKKVRFESMSEDMAFTPAERYIGAQDQKANSKVPLTRDLIEADEELESAVQRAVDIGRG